MYIIVAPDILWTPILAAPLSLYIVFCARSVIYVPRMKQLRKRVAGLLAQHKINCVIITAARNSSEPLVKKRLALILELTAP